MEEEKKARLEKNRSKGTPTGDPQQPTETQKARAAPANTSDSTQPETTLPVRHVDEVGSLWMSSGR